MEAYGSLCTEFYDLDKPAAPAAALAYYLDRARDAQGRILEPMCGSGRFLIPMLRAGLPIDGVDASRAMKRHDGDVVSREEEAIALRQLEAGEVLSLLADCGFSERTVTPSSSLPWLAASGCFLVEARAGV